MEGRNFRQNDPPVKIGDELDVKIEAVGEKGDGIAKKDGFVLFVPNTQQGQQVKIKVTKVLRKVGFAEVVGEGQASEKPSTEGSEAPYEESSESSEETTEEASEDTEDFGEENQEQ